MKPLPVVALSLLTIATFASCSAFEDPTPSNIIFELRGETGTQVQVIYATQFVAGVNELGVTEVQVFSSDTVIHTMPVDTVISIEIDRRWFVHVSPLESDTLSVEVIVDVDNRNLVRESGGIFPDTPWIFVYMFNTRLTRLVDVVF